MSRLTDSLELHIHDWILDRRFDGFRAQVMAGVTGRVLEIGAGTGLNFGFYPRGVEVVAIEPNAPLRARALERSRAARTQAGVEVVDAVAERLPFEACSFDSAVITFTLCSIDRVAEALAELHRVLRPGATVHLAEHVVDAEGAERWQRRVQPVWTRVFGGCSLTRDPKVDLAGAGFAVEGIERVHLPLPRLARAGMVGVARRLGS